MFALTKFVLTVSLSLAAPAALDSTPQDQAVAPRAGSAAADLPGTQPPPEPEPGLSPEPEPVAPDPPVTAGLALEPPQMTQEPEAQRKAEVTVGLQAFIRGQGRANPDFNKADDTRGNLVQVLERFRLHARGTWGPLVGFAQVQEARTFTFERGDATQAGGLSVHQGFAEVHGERSGGKLSGLVRVGRQEIAWGRQRLVGALLWAPGARAFNAVRATGSYGRWTLDGFASYRISSQTVAAPVDPSAPDTSPPAIQVNTAGFFGATRLELAAHKAFAVEVMGLLDHTDAHPSNLGEERLIGDVGARVWGAPVRGITYDAEAHVQAGERAGLKHQAWAWAAAADWVGDKTKTLWPGAGLGYAMGSGHACTATPDVGCAQTRSRDFFNFYPTNHIHYGIADTMNWANARDLEIRSVLGHRSLLDVRLAYHWLQLQRPDGRWTNAGGAPQADGWDPTNDANTLGHELDVVASVRPWKPVVVSAGYAAFVPGAAAKQLSAPNLQHFFYLWLVATF